MGERQLGHVSLGNLGFLWAICPGFAPLSGSTRALMDRTHGDALLSARLKITPSPPPEAFRHLLRRLLR